jgi:hypothetical protein
MACVEALSVVGAIPFAQLPVKFNCSIPVSNLFGNSNFRRFEQPGLLNELSPLEWVPKCFRAPFVGHFADELTGLQEAFLFNPAETVKYPEFLHNDYKNKHIYKRPTIKTMQNLNNIHIF